MLANPTITVRRAGTPENHGTIPLLMDMGDSTHLDTTTRIGGYRNHPDNRLDYRRHRRIHSRKVRRLIADQRQHQQRGCGVRH